MRFPTIQAAPPPRHPAMPRPSDYCDFVLPYLLSAVARLCVISPSCPQKVHIVCHYNSRVIEKSLIVIKINNINYVQTKYFYFGSFYNVSTKAKLILRSSITGRIESVDTCRILQTGLFKYRVKSSQKYRETLSNC